MAASEIIVPDKEFALALSKHIIDSIPEEKTKVVLRQARAARAMQQAGSIAIEGVGQRVASIDPRLYFRCLHSFGHHENWLDDLIADNPQLRAPGYHAKRKGDLRHGITFMNGIPMGKGPQTKG